MLFPEGSKKTQGITDLEAVMPDLGNGLGVYSKVTPPFLITIGPQTGKSSCEFIFCFSGHTL